MLASRQQDAKGLKVANLKRMASQVTEDHLKVHRPWGSPDRSKTAIVTISNRIIVRLGQWLSPQKLRHRSEHRIVVRGAARVTVNEQVKTGTRANQSTSRSAQCIGSKNPGKILELIEGTERQLPSARTTSSASRVYWRS